MFSFKVLILLSTCFAWSLGKLNKYCSICEDHTMCKFEGIGSECVDAGGSGVTDLERKEILDVHNWLRRIVASGYETKGVDGPQPKAANLRKLIWDDELSRVAQRWADQCKFQHDTCRNDPRWNVGQNIYWKWKYPTHHVNWTEAIFSWYNEVSLYNPNEVEAYRFEAATGHYTQILWHDTYTVGCGRRDYGANKLYVCNYGPAGNWIGEPLYAVGEPCSQCPQGTYCDEYLCDLQNQSQPIKPGKLENRVGETNGVTSLGETSTTKSTDDTHLEVLTPPKENAQDVYGSDHKPTPNQTQHSQIIREHEHHTIYDPLTSDEEPQKTTTNSIDDDDAELDEETRNALEEIKTSLEKLLRKVVKKLKSCKV